MTVLLAENATVGPGWCIQQEKQSIGPHSPHPGRSVHISCSFGTRDDWCIMTWLGWISPVEAACMCPCRPFTFPSTSLIPLYLSSRVLITFKLGCTRVRQDVALLLVFILYSKRHKMSQSRFYKPRPTRGASRGTRRTEVTPIAPFGPTLETLSRSEVLHESKEAKTACITDCETMASFNWLGERDAHIVVPGL